MLAVVLLFAFVASALSALADDSYKPYLHEASVPEHPKLELKGVYKTNLYPGAATYTYPIDVPPGTNGLQPSLSIAYNSQSAKQRPGIASAGWSLSSDYVYRHVNSTPANTSDDYFILVFAGSSHELVFNSSEGRYHTEIESYLRVQNLTGAPNTYSAYWLVTAKDGTQYRFGYNAESELTSNQGRSYALKWHPDQIEDTFGNHIYYHYTENPYGNDTGAVYLSQITYNNEEARLVNFTYESSDRPDRRRVYEQGNLLEESRRLSEIKIYANNALVRRHTFTYASLNSANSLTALTSLKHYGSDGSSLLHQVQFGYHDDKPGFTQHTSDWVQPVLFTATYTEDWGVRLVDLNNDGFVDFIQGRMSGSTKKVWLNNKASGWAEDSRFAPPIYISDSTHADNGVRFLDLDNDGLLDILQSAYKSGSVKKAYLNNGSGWEDVSSTWDAPVYFIDNVTDQGVILTDLDGDGSVDLLQSENIGGASKKAWLNNGSGWRDVSSVWVPPVYFVDASGDTGVRIEDVNGDGLPDILEGRDTTYNAWLNNGTGWVDATSVWAPPAAFKTASRADNGVRFADLNGDGLTDFLWDYDNGTTSDKSAWLNTGSGWASKSAWIAPTPFTEAGNNIGRRLADADGDGFADILVGYSNATAGVNNATWLKNATTAYLLKSITNEFGGITTVDYGTSTQYNNTGNDSVSDLGYNVWVVSNVSRNNSLSGSFNTFGVTRYNYTNGSHDYDDKEFRGFGLVIETRPDNASVYHYFHQSDSLKGKEYRTEIYDSAGSIMSKSVSSYSSAGKSGYFVVSLDWQSSYTHDGTLENPKITNTTYSYDSYGNPVWVNSSGDISRTGDEKHEHYAYAMNTSAYVVGRVCDNSLYGQLGYPKIRQTLYYYDSQGYCALGSRGALTKVERWLDTELANPTTEYTYDDYGNVITETDALGLVTRYYYGLRDSTYTFAERVVNALDHAADAQYDPGTGNLLWSEKNDLRTEFEYDVHGRVSKEILPYDTTQSPTKAYTYTLDGTAPESVVVRQRTTANNTLDTHYFYDGFGQLVQVRSPADSGNQVVADVLYDSSGRVSETSNPYFSSFNASLTNPSTTANSTTFTYDALDRPIRIVNPDGTTLNTTFSRWNVSSYDANGHRIGYALDAYGRISHVLEYNNDPVLYLDYESDIYMTNYSYDAADQLVNITDFDGNVFAFGYDSLGRRVLLDDPDMGAWAYTYDLAGNLVSQSGGGGNLVTGDSYYREYNSLNQLIRIRSGNLSTGTILEEYTYDAYGDRVKVYKNQSNETIYTPFRELTRVVNSNGTYNYLYVYDGSTLVARLNPDGSRWFYHADHLGSTTLITDETGNVVEETFYEPYGAVISGGEQESKLYTGHFADSPEQYYFGARYVDPYLGRFIQPDAEIPLLYNPQDLNRYAYTRNNPFVYMDDDGQSPTLVTAVIGVGVGALIGGSVSAVSQYVGTGTVDWGDVGKSAVVGGVAGGVAGLTLGVGNLVAGGAGLSLGGEVALGAASSVAGGRAATVTSNVIEGEEWSQDLWDPGAIATDAAIGGVTAGAVEVFKGQYLKSSWSAGGKGTWQENFAYHQTTKNPAGYNSYRFTAEANKFQTNLGKSGYQSSYTQVGQRYNGFSTSNQRATPGFRVGNSKTGQLVIFDSQGKLYSYHSPKLTVKTPKVK